MGWRARSRRIPSHLLLCSSSHRVLLSAIPWAPIKSVVDFQRFKLHALLIPIAGSTFPSEIHVRCRLLQSHIHPERGRMSNHRVELRIRFSFCGRASTSNIVPEKGRVVVRVGLDVWHCFTSSSIQIYNYIYYLSTTIFSRCPEHTTVLSGTSPPCVIHSTLKDNLNSLNTQTKE